MQAGIEHLEARSNHINAEEYIGVLFRMPIKKRFCQTNKEVIY